MRRSLTGDLVDLREDSIDRADSLRNRRVHARRGQIEDHARQEQDQPCKDPKGVLGYLFDVPFQIVHGAFPDRMAIDGTRCWLISLGSCQGADRQLPLSGSAPPAGAAAAGAEAAAGPVMLANSPGFQANWTMKSNLGAGKFGGTTFP